MKRLKPFCSRHTVLLDAALSLPLTDWCSPLFFIHGQDTRLGNVMNDTAFKTVLVGAGNMGCAMLAGWLDNGFDASSISAIDPNPTEEKREWLQKAGVKVAGSPDGIEIPDALIIAVKPQLMADVLPGLKALVGDKTVCISVAAGVKLANLQSHLGETAIVRCMPNTPALLKRGMTAACPNSHVTAQQREKVNLLLEANGKVEWIEDERLIDAVTAVSGSGPAYVFHLAECMAEAGIAEGLPETLAHSLARETIAGAGEMLSQLPETSARLRENVTSPNGTTAAAMSVFMRDDAMKSLVAKAIHAARKRSEELS